MATLVERINALTEALALDAQFVSQALQEISGGLWITITPDSTFTAQGGAPTRWRKNNGEVTLDVNLKVATGGNFGGQSSTVNQNGINVTLNSNDPLPADICPPIPMNLQINTNTQVIRLVVNSAGLMIVQIPKWDGTGTKYVVGHMHYRV